jgi:hypothetical protein
VAAGNVVQSEYRIGSATSLKIIAGEWVLKSVMKRTDTSSNRSAMAPLVFQPFATGCGSMFSSSAALCGLGIGRRACRSIGPALAAQWRPLQHSAGKKK